MGTNPIDEAVMLLRLDDRNHGPGAGRATSNDHQVDLPRLLDRLAEHAASNPIEGVRDLSTVVLRAWEHSLAAGDVVVAHRMVTLARAIRANCAGDHGDGIAMIG